MPVFDFSAHATTAPTAAFSAATGASAFSFYDDTALSAFFDDHGNAGNANDDGAVSSSFSTTSSSSVSSPLYPLATAPRPALASDLAANLDNLGNLVFADAVSFGDDDHGFDTHHHHHHNNNNNHHELAFSFSRQGYLASHHKDSLRTRAETGKDHVQVIRGRAAFPRLALAVHHRDPALDGSFATDVADDNHLVWEILYADGSPVHRCSKCAADVHAFGFRYSRPPRKVVEYGSPTGADAHANPGVFGPVRYGRIDADTAGLNLFPLFFNCLTHYHDAPFVLRVTLVQAGRPDVAVVTPPFEVRAKFPRGTQRRKGNGNKALDPPLPDVGQRAHAHVVAASAIKRTADAADPDAPAPSAKRQKVAPVLAAAADNGGDHDHHQQQQQRLLDDAFLQAMSRELEAVARGPPLPPIPVRSIDSFSSTSSACDDIPLVPTSPLASPPSSMVAMPDPVVAPMAAPKEASVISALPADEAQRILVALADNNGLWDQVMSLVHRQ